MDRVVAAEGLGGGGVGSDCSWGQEGLLLGCRECSGTRQRLWLHNIMNILNATELFTLKQLILCDVNCPSIRKHRKVARK